MLTKIKHWNVYHNRYQGAIKNIMATIVKLLKTYAIITVTALNDVKTKTETARNNIIATIVTAGNNVIVNDDINSKDSTAVNHNNNKY